jgi:hypothetical protein
MTHGKMLKSKKHVLWEALIITITIFLLGLFLGMILENSNSIKINNLFAQSETSLVDAMTTSKLLENSKFDCEVIKQNNIDFADRIYEEAKLLEEYEESGKLTENMKVLHKKYDLLRTLVWTNNQESLKFCDNYNLIIYLYEYNSEEINTRAINNVWSKILLEVKEGNNDVLLLPIAVDQDLASLDLLMSYYKVEQFPALIINDKDILQEVNNVKDVEAYLS